ncbi:hypothetical protein AMQ83_09575, partial [Paenibacillus riograndensis]
MANYLKSELYRVVHKKALYFFLAACIWVPLFMTLLTAASGGDNYANTEFVFKAASDLWIVVVFIMCLIFVYLIHI